MRVAAVTLLIGAVLALAAPSGAVTALPPIRHVWIIQLENESSQASTADPGYLGRQLPKLGEILTDYYATGHESLDNYISEVSGQAPNAETQADCQLYTDVTPGTVVGGQAVGEGCVYPSDVPTVVNQLAAKGLTWRAYMQDMGATPSRDHTTPAGDCGHPLLNTQDGTQLATTGDQYATRHDPFVYFHSIIDNPATCANVVPLSRLAGDLASAAATPNYNWITPNLCSDGHDAVCTGTNLDGTHAGGFVGIDDFLSRYVPEIMASPAYRANGMIVVTFDESADDDGAACCGATPGPGSPLPGIVGPGGGHIETIVVSPFIRPGSTDGTPYNHYALLRTTEDIFGVGYLGEAGNPGEQSFGPDVFNAYAAATPTTAPAPSPAPIGTTPSATPATSGSTSSSGTLPLTGGDPPILLGAGLLLAGLVGWRFVASHHST